MSWGTPQIVTTVISFIAGMLAGAVIAGYFLKKQAEKFQKQVANMNIDKEQLRIMSSTLGRKLSEEQLNKMMEDVKKLKKNSAESRKKPKNKEKK